MDKYKIERKIDDGNQGAIFLSTRIDSNDKKLYAVKQIPCTSTEELNRVQNEIDLVLKLDHPNVVKHYESFIEEKDSLYIPEKEYNVYIVMDYCSGGSMESLLTKLYKNNQNLEQPTILPDSLKIKWVRQIVEVLQYLKERNIIHRDMKPDNILFHTDNENYDHIEDYNVRVCDFGFTKDLAGESSTNTFVGTPVYMPPEILARGKYDHSADIWSLGVSIVQLLIQVDKNHVPDLRKEIHLDSSYVNNMKDKLNTNITKNVSWNPTLNRLASTCCQLDPKNRPTPQDLLRIISQHENKATPTSPESRPVSLSNRRNPFANLMTLNFGRASMGAGSTGTPKQVAPSPPRKNGTAPSTPTGGARNRICSVM